MFDVGGGSGDRTRTSEDHPVSNQSPTPAFGWSLLVLGGSGGTRTRGAAALRGSKPAPSTSRPHFLMMETEQGLEPWRMGFAIHSSRPELGLAEVEGFEPSRTGFGIPPARPAPTPRCTLQLCAAGRLPPGVRALETDGSIPDPACTPFGRQHDQRKKRRRRHDHDHDPVMPLHGQLGLRRDGMRQALVSDHLSPAGAARGERREVEQHRKGASASAVAQEPGVPRGTQPPPSAPGSPSVPSPLTVSGGQRGSRTPTGFLRRVYSALASPRGPLCPP